VIGGIDHRYVLARRSIPIDAGFINARSITKMEWILLFVVLMIVVRIKYHDLFTSGKDHGSSSGDPETSKNLYYELNSELFSAAERSFLHALDIALKGKLRIYAKVRVADIVNVKKGLSRSEWGAQFGRIKAKK